jgi:polar amino acid transport system substrate-binding protein
MNRFIPLEHHILLILVITSLCGVACRDLPRDPKETLDRVQSGRLRVGVVENPPWVVRTDGEPAGTEAILVREFAQNMKVTPEWGWGSEQQHMKALEHFELDLVIGGVTKDTPWKKSVGLTSPYYEDRISVGVPNSVPLPLKIKGLRIAARRGEPVAAYLEKKRRNRRAR